MAGSNEQMLHLMAALVARRPTARKPGYPFRYQRANGPRSARRSHQQSTRPSQVPFLQPGSLPTLSGDLSGTGNQPWCLQCSPSGLSRSHRRPHAQASCRWRLRCGFSAGCRGASGQLAWQTDERAPGAQHARSHPTHPWAAHIRPSRLVHAPWLFHPLPQPLACSSARRRRGCRCAARASCACRRWLMQRRRARRKSAGRAR